MRVHVTSPNVFAAEQCHSQKPTPQPEHELAVHTRRILKLGEVRGLQELPKQRVLSPWCLCGGISRYLPQLFAQGESLGDPRRGTGDLE